MKPFSYKLIFILSVFVNLFGLKSYAQPPAGAVAAKPNIIYYAGGSCVFYDANNTILLSVDANEAGWSATPAKAAWVVVTPSSGGYYEFPNYSANATLINASQYLQPFWKSDTIFNELVLLSGVNSSAKLMYEVSKIVSVTNYDFSTTFTPNTDYTVSGRSITQVSARVSAGYSQKVGKKGNGQSNGLLNTNPTSWVCVTYIPNRANWDGNSIFSNKSKLLPNTISKLVNGQPLVIEAYGMSITAGLNVSGFAGDDKNFTPTKPYMHSYVDLFGDALRQKFTSNIIMINGSCGGKTVGWIDRYCTSMVIPNQPDLVLLDMGMNDIWGTSNDSFSIHMQSCINKIKAANPKTEFLLIGNMLPDIGSMGAPSNGDKLMYGFLNQLNALETNGIAVLDMTTMSDSIYKRKGAIHCTSNSLHPNDYLARWYAQGLVNLIGDAALNFTPRTYYVNTSGTNGDGLSKATAWTSLSKVNTAQFNPGDSILFEGGATFTGSIELDNKDGNDPLKPIYYGTYGFGKATIATNNAALCGFKATNTQGVHISNLVFTGPGNGTQKDIDGILFYTTNTTGYLSNISIKNVEVSGFSYCGIRFYSNWIPTVKAGFKDVVIENCKVHDCRDIGIVSFAYDDQNTNFYHHKNFTIRNTEVYNITGYSASSHKGSGIVLSQIDSALIEKCVAYNNGINNTACGGPGGIWVWAANSVVIQYCESHHNSSGKTGGCDGLGFDLDGGVTNSFLQYCYSHDNDGAGILLGNFIGARPWGNNTVRYNISVNDARTNNSAVTLFTAPSTVWNGLKFYNNTIFVTPSSKNTTSGFGAFQITDFGNSMTGIECYNNIFQTTGGLQLLSVPAVFAAQNPKFNGNLYYASGDKFNIWFGSAYTSLSIFRNSGTNCEKINGTQTGLEGDPLLTGLNLGSVTVYPKPTDSLGAYKFGGTSPAKDAGLNLITLFGIDPGQRDFWNNANKSGSSYDIGAFEYQEKTTGLIRITSLQNFVKLVPNPSLTGSINLVFNKTVTNPVQIEVIDCTGKHCFQTIATTKEIVDNTLELPLSGLENGMYMVKVNHNAAIINLKLLISK